MIKKNIFLKLLVIFMIFAGYGRAEDIYKQPPSYSQDSQLEDIWSMAEIVVSGSIDKQTITVEKKLFGKLSEPLKPNPVLQLSGSSKGLSGQSGVWFLVKAPDGYEVLNPNHKVVTIEKFKKLSPPKNHWTSQEGLIVNNPGKHQFYYIYKDEKTKHNLMHGPNVYRYRNGDLLVTLYSHNEKEIRFMIDSAGEYETIAKYPEKGHGFFLEYDKGRLIEFCHFKDRSQHGLHRKYYKSKPKQLREEKNLTNGVVDGYWRKWKKDGEVVRDDFFKNGLITPIFEYKGKDKSGTMCHRSKDGVSYSMARGVNKIKVGMTTQQVSDIIKADFSPSQGLMFSFYQMDQYLFIGFKDGKVNEIRTGHNGICIEIRPWGRQIGL